MKLLAIEVGQFGDYYNSRYQQVEQYGVELYVLSGVADQDHWHAGQFFISHSMDISDLTQLATQLHQEHHFDGVFTFAENSVIATAIIANALQLPSIAVEAAVKSRNKIAMREAHRDGLAPHPAFHLTPTLHDALQASFELGYPVILKPTLGSASQFVYKINSPAELEEIFPKALAGINEMSQFKNEGITEFLGPNSLLVESYLDGREYLIEAYSWDGVTVLGSIVDRVTLEGNSFDDDVHHAPTDLSGQDLQRVHAAVHAGAVAQGLTRSVMHAEIRFHQGLPYIVEIAARPGGGGLDFMARISANYCPIKAVIDVAIGNKPAYAHYAPTGKHTFALCLISAPGKIESIAVPNEIRGDPDTFMLKIISPIGSVIKRPPLGNDIIGFLGVMGDSRQESEDKAMAYSQRVNVTTR
ncbi:ATP-grasp domain-containing protein [Rahnella sp. SL6]|uniref:ATP-grasp domain-containing protein n=1 Tax=Rahnella perminowiae TaxID=2816244 RepID=UPI001C2601ED|nr:ATP-grasp domain-containing protein [Rahnella perminowiae]MBU9809434.1 ATP-grasp domain-containing protein [Rahnella perminowiae]